MGQINTEADVIKVFEKMTSKVIYDVLRQSSNNLRVARVVSVDSKSSSCKVSLMGTGKLLQNVKYPANPLLPSVGDTCLVLSVDPVVQSQNFIVSFYGNKNNQVPAFWAYKSAAQAITTGFNLIQVNKKFWDITNDFVQDTYRFVATTPGIYTFFGGVHVQGLSDTNRVIAIIYKNGVEGLRGNDASVGAANDGGFTVGGDLLLLKGDYVQLYAFVSANKNTLTNVQYNYFGGHLVQQTV